MASRDAAPDSVTVALRAKLGDCTPCLRHTFRDRPEDCLGKVGRPLPNLLAGHLILTVASGVVNSIILIIN